MCFGTNEYIICAGSNARATVKSTARTGQRVGVVEVELLLALEELDRLQRRLADGFIERIVDADEHIVGGRFHARHLECRLLVHDELEVTRQAHLERRVR